MANRSAILTAAHTIVIAERPVPRAGPDDVLVAVQAVGICGSDVHYYEHGRIGNFVVEEPMIIGHEAAGTIVSVGERVDPARVGERVALEPGVPCRRCPQCKAGRYNLCPDVVFFATPPVDGAIAQQVVIAADFAHPVPDSLTFDQAALAEPVSVGIWAARKAAIALGDRVLVTGAGPIGLLAGQVARAFGAAEVAITDLSEFRRSVATRLGLTAYHPDDVPGAGFDVLVECSGAQAALTGGLAALDRAARAVLVGMGADEVTIDVPLIQSREITLTGTFRYANTYPLAIELLASGAVRVDELITHRFAIDRTEDALTVNRRETDALKCVVLPQESS